MLKRMVRGLRDAIVWLFEDHCKCEFVTMKFHFLHYICDDLENFLAYTI